MTVIPQMTPYGIYNITYRNSAKRAEVVESKAPVTGYGRAYDSLSFLRAFQGLAGESIALQKNEYRKQIVDVMTSAHTLSEVAEEFLSDDWPGLKLEGQDGIKGEVLKEAQQKEYQVEVRQLAESHTYQSRSLAAGERDILPPGTYDLEIMTKKGREKTVFDVRAKDTARYTMARIADSINTFSANVAAKVIKEDGFAYLEIKAKSSGGEGTFQLASSTGSWLEELGLSLRQSGMDGEVMVDGSVYKTNNNKLELDDGKLKLAFSKTGKGKVGIAPDKEGAIMSMGLLAQAYNNFSSMIKNASNSTDKGTRLLNAASGMFKGTNSEAFVAAGLSMDENGELAFSPEKAGKATNDNLLQVRELLAKGAAFAFYNIANSVQNSPISYYFSLSGPSGTLEKLENLPEKWQGIFVDIAA